MLQFIADNIANIVIVALLLAAVIGIIASMAKKKAKGQSISCGCGCSECPSASVCHTGQEDKK
ncbi:FeoB-associated Cys-rich membrane protein [Thermoclostridium caenicola]|uniref:Virus attachment protein p12 family protein n=1 Tax=Thermoclostridium caenicola TaxID=659425 RepID=A0A1M6CP90_9FIRM|nr:FeoB-associated Cys-rich membrane protein [Thermoclostridium caenicola]SHI62852.1 Virus attachment protein p12 family protein [Thermoclostridium caenicola]HOP71637.1 FeoB-associated Cys-rich membrane protein [Thermoclostridium caenicola]